MLFLFHAALPMLLASSVLIIYQWQIDVMMGFELLSYFSPLTNWDVFIVYTFQTSGFIMPIILHKSYKRMEKSLAEFSQLYIQSMHGVICKGINHFLFAIYIQIQRDFCYVNLGEIENVFDEVTTKQVVFHSLAVIIGCSCATFYMWILWYLVPIGNLPF